MSSKILKGSVIEYASAGTGKSLGAVEHDCTAAAGGCGEAAVIDNCRGLTAGCCVHPHDFPRCHECLTCLAALPPARRRTRLLTGGHLICLHRLSEHAQCWCVSLINLKLP